MKRAIYWLRLVLHQSRVGDVNVCITSEVAIMSNKEDVICDQMTDLVKPAAVFI